MCYAIPGKIIEINQNTVTLDYFGEQRRARNDFLKVAIGEYVYAQGGFVIQRIPEAKAAEILEAWKEMFFILKETDKKLAYQSGDLRQQANAIRQKHQGNACCVHGIIEFSNYCNSDCLYCGIRAGNPAVNRYRMSVDEIIETAKFSINELKFKALVLQSGEDNWYDADKLVKIVSEIMKHSPALLILSIGEREEALYKKLYDAGARGVLLRFESSNPNLYTKMKPQHVLDERLTLIKKLADMGYLIMTGFLIGLPGQTQEDILNDIKLTSSLGTDMFSFGPFIPHPQTPLADAKLPSIDEVLDTIARARIMNPEAKILVTSAMETLDRENGLRAGLLSGGNSLMINVTPAKYQQLYDIYPHRAGVNVDVKEKIDVVLKLLYAIGRAPVDLGI